VPDDPPTDQYRDHLRASTQSGRHETALREILQVISQSRADETSVFDVILKNATDLCDAPFAGLYLLDDARREISLVASLGARSEYLSGNARRWPIDDPASVGVAIRECRVVQADDIRKTDAYQRGNEQRVEAADIEGIRTFLAVPLIRDGKAIGAIGLYRREVAPFQEPQIDLVESFATQAVIAIENVRQFRELQTRLQREEATREILHVISQNREDEIPVFEAILERAQRLCDAQAAGLQLVTRDRTHSQLVVGMGLGGSVFAPGDEFDLSAPTALATAVREARVIHMEDLKNSQLYRDGSPLRVKLVDEEGVRTQLTVPLLKDGTAFGTMTLSRYEQRPFSSDEIALVETFAAQAVIAIENVRQFREVQTRLEREAATREVLEVISQSRADEAPVFHSILENAVRLCAAPHALLLMRNEADTHLQLVASNSAQSAFIDSLRDNPHEIANKGSAAILALDTMQAQHLPDVREHLLGSDRAPQLSVAADVEGMRTTLLVPLISGGRAIGVLSVYKLEVAPFSDGEVALMKTFAAQAVIAIENVRQFREVQTRLEREAASREILQVISASRDDTAPVFDVILRNAACLAGAPFANLCVLNAARSHWHLAAHFGDGLRHLVIGQVTPLQSELIPGVTMRTAQVTQIEDLTETDLYRQGDPGRVAMVDVEGMRTIVGIPLLKRGEPIGCITLFRREVKAFTADEIALVETFAAQAVIAIENVRQFKDLETLNSELGDRVQDQVGELERMGRLKRFLPAAVADTVVSQGSDKMLSSHRALLGVLFCDIRGFTAFCETAEPEETIEVLQTYHEEMGKLIVQHGAGVDHRSGDGIMVLFNDPLPCEDPAGDALRLALAMRARMEDLCRSWKRLGHRLGFGVGVSLGYATVGMVGFEGRFDYTASGTAVNLASRLCDSAEDGEILLSPRAYTAVEDDFTAESAGALSFKGIREPVEVFRITGKRTD
jgi:GAF domain-containing protein